MIAALWGDRDNSTKQTTAIVSPVIAGELWRWTASMRNVTTIASEEQQVASTFAASDDDHVLVERAASGDADAFAILYRRYLPEVHAFAYRRCGSREIAEDVTAAAFEKALRNIGSFQPSGGGFPAWLFRITANQMNDHHRRSSRPSSDRGQIAMQRLVTEAETPDAVVLQGENHEMVRAALEQLSPRYRTALSLRYLSGLTNEEAAEAMGVTRGTMAVLVHRSLKSMRRHLDASRLGLSSEEPS